MSQTTASAAPAWRTSTRCDGGACVEVALAEEGVAIRNNTSPETHLTFDAASWNQLLGALRAGEL